MDSSPAPTARTLRTRQRLIDAALDLFEQRGYDQTTAADIARAAEVTEVTFFRHFATKDQLLLDDPFDPLLAASVVARPAGPPLVRVVEGMRSVWRALPEPTDEFTRRRIRIVASTPGLRAAVARSNARTEVAIADALIDAGGDPLECRIAVAAVLAAMSVALLEWSVGDGASLGDMIDTALDVLVARDA